jgi:hypothetical protein
LSGEMLAIACGPRAVESDTLGEISGLADEEICYVRLEKVVEV